MQEAWEVNPQAAENNAKMASKPLSESLDFCCGQVALLSERKAMRHPFPGVPMLKCLCVFTATYLYLCWDSLGSVSWSVLVISVLDPHTNWKLHSIVCSFSLRQLSIRAKNKGLGPSRPSFESHHLNTLDKSSQLSPSQMSALH